MNFPQSTALPPHFYVATNLVISAGSIYVMSLLGLHEDYFFLPVIALAAAYGFLYFIRQCTNHGKKRHTHFYIEKSLNFRKIFRRALARYLVWLVVLYGGYQFYLLMPPYSAVAHHNTHALFASFLHWYLWLGLPYFALTLILKASRREDFYDPAIRFIHVFKQIIFRSLRGDSRQSIFRVFHKSYNRKVFLNLLMRAYFIPVMVEQITPTASSTLTLFYRELDSHSLLSLLMLISAALWLLDILNAAIAYCLESRWLENRSSSIDLTIGGWLVCLSSYAPLNQITGSVIAFAPHVASNQLSDLLFTGIGFFYLLKLVEITILATHIYTDASLGPSVANITLKKLQTRGPYGIIRHPGTATKLLYWLVKSIFYKKFWTAKYLVGYFGWGVLYILRALTEERHLKKFSEYRDYMTKVKYRFFPGLF